MITCKRKRELKNAMRKKKENECERNKIKTKAWLRRRQI